MTDDRKPTKLTKRHREVFDQLSTRAAFSRETAQEVWPPLDGGADLPADKMAAIGLINKRYDTKHGAVYWIRARGEEATGAAVPAGFVVILHRNLTTPSGKRENLFLARALYDGKSKTFRALLRGWMMTLDLKPKDLLSSSMGFELHDPDEPLFRGDHVILDDLP